MNEQKEIKLVSFGSLKFRAIITKQFLRDGRHLSTFIKFGGRNPECITIGFSYIPNKTATIPLIEGNPQCTLVDSDFYKSSLMLILALQFAHEIEPSIDEYVFRDANYITCITNDRTFNRSLSCLYIAKYGYTWYEKYFNATFVNEEQYNIYRNNINKLYDIDEKLFFNIFVDKYVPNKNIREFIKLNYENSLTYSEFFNSFEKDEQCYAYLGWIEQFMTDLLGKQFMKTDWIIRISSLPDAGEPNVKSIGGKKYNTKRRNNRSKRFRRTHKK